MVTRFWPACAVGLIFLATPGGRAAPPPNDNFTGTKTEATAEQRPANITSPVVTGRPVAGEMLSTSTGEWQGLPTTYRYQWQRCGSLDDAGENVAFGKPATASAHRPDHPPQDAVDGNFFSYWSGFSPPEWFEVDLLAPYQRGYDHAGELAALTSARVVAAVRAAGIELTSYADAVSRTV